MKIRSLAELRPGQWLWYWHDTGCFGGKQLYCRVVRVNRRSATVRGEVGDRDVRVSEERLDAFESVDAAEAENCIRHAGRWHRFANWPER